MRAPHHRCTEREAGTARLVRRPEYRPEVTESVPAELPRIENRSRAPDVGPDSATYPLHLGGNRAQGRGPRRVCPHGGGPDVTLPLLPENKSAPHREDDAERDDAGGRLAAPPLLNSLYGPARGVGSSAARNRSH